MKKAVLIFPIVCCLLLSCETAVKPSYAINVSFKKKVGSTPLDGRLLLMLSSDDSAEPRFQINDGLNTQLIFGMNVTDWEPDSIQTFDDAIFGYPYKSLADVPQENIPYRPF